MISRKMEKIILLEFKRTSDCGESYFQDMRRVAEQQHVPILAGLRGLAEERGWEIEVVPMVAGQRSGQRKGVARSTQDIRDRERGGSKDHRETGAYAP